MTRYCSECGQPGHNTRTCPRITEDYKDRYFAFREKGLDYFEVTGETHDYYEARQEEYRKRIIERTGTDPETGQAISEELRKALVKRKTKCSYCEQRGHTRRTCKYLKEDIQVKKYTLSTFRQKAQETLERFKINLGTLIVAKDKDYNNQTGAWFETTHVYIVTGFDWEKTTYNNNVKAICFVAAELLGTPDDYYSHRRNKRHFSINQLCDAERRTGCGILEVSGCSRGVRAPQNWLEAGDHLSRAGGTLKDECFPPGQRRTVNYKIYAYKDPDHPFYEVRKALGLSMVVDY